MSWFDDLVQVGSETNVRWVASTCPAVSPLLNLNRANPGVGDMQLLGRVPSPWRADGVNGGVYQETSSPAGAQIPVTNPVFIHFSRKTKENCWNGSYERRWRSHKLHKQTSEL